MILSFRYYFRALVAFALTVGFVPALFAAAQVADGHWVGTWASAPLAEQAVADSPKLAGATLRQIVHVSLGGNRLRVRISNTFGHEPLQLHGAHVAAARPLGAIDPDTDRPLCFSGESSVSVPEGAVVFSDPVDFKVAPLSDLAVSIYIDGVPQMLTAHPGSRTTSYLQVGNALADGSLPQASNFVHWYFINGVDVYTEASESASIVTLGDSITDGYGCLPDQNTRWPDEFARCLYARAGALPLGVLNQGIGGNRLLRDGLGPNVLSRFDRDVIAQTGVRWVIVLAGINDIGTRIDARAKKVSFASAAEIIAAYQQLIARAHTHGLRIIGATITPYEGAKSYWSPDGESDRQTINEWIRKGGLFDAVIDFDAVLRDNSNPSHLAAAYDSGDHLHPSIAGYKQMADSVDLNLFQLHASCSLRKN